MRLPFVPCCLARLYYYYYSGLLGVSKQEKFVLFVPIFRRGTIFPSVFPLGVCLARLYSTTYTVYYLSTTCYLG